MSHDNNIITVHLRQLFRKSPQIYLGYYRHRNDQTKKTNYSSEQLRSQETNLIRLLTDVKISFQVKDDFNDVLTLLLGSYILPIYMPSSGR